GTCRCRPHRRPLCALYDPLRAGSNSGKRFPPGVIASAVAPLHRAQPAGHRFELVAARYEHGSMILTSNTSFAQWGQLLGGDEILATALLDRLLHHAEIISISGRSYRMKERQA